MNKTHPGYRVLHDSYTGEGCLALTGPWREEFDGLVGKRGVSSVRLSAGLGWDGNSIEFVRTLGRRLKGLEIYCPRVPDITPIMDATSLLHLGIDTECERSGDLSGLSSLRSACVEWKPCLQSILSSPSLEYLNVTSFPFLDLGELGSLTRLRKLLLQSTQLRDLSGIELLEGLEELDLSYCSHLHSIEGVDTLPRLRTLEVLGSRIGDIEPLRGVRGLRRLRLENCREVESLLPLESSTNIEEVFIIGETTLADGKVRWLFELKSLKRVGIRRRRHYDLSKRELRDLQEKL